MRTVFLIVVLGLSNILFAQQDLIVQTLNIESGLSQSVVNDLLVDSKGFVWVGTQNGLNRFDGYNFKVFYNEPIDEYSISSDFITCLAEDAINNLWIGTSSGLNRFDQRTHHFIHYGLPSNNIEFPQFHVISLLVDGENSVWVLLPEYLVRINPVNDNMRVFSLNESITKNQYCSVNGLYESANSSISFVVDTKLVVFDKVFEKFDVLDFKNSLGDRCLTGVFEAEESTYVTTDNAIYEIQSSSSLRRVFFKGLDGEVFTAFRKKKETFIITNDGCYHFNDGEFKLDQVFVNTSGELLRNYITVADIDSSNNLWIGTSGKGVLKTNITKPRFQTITHEAFENKFLSDDQISSIWVEPDTVWIGTYEYGLNILSKLSRTIKLISVDNRPDLLKSNNIYDICKIKNRYIIATDKGFSIIKQLEGEFVSERHENLENFMGRIYDIVSVGDSVFYYSYAGVLYRYGLNSGKLVSHTFDMDNEGGITNSFSIEKVRDDLLFVGTSYGLFRFDLRVGYWDRFLFDKEDTFSVSGNNIYALDFDVHNRLWVGTSNGLTYVDDPYAKKMKFNRMLGNKKHTVYSIAAGKKFVWVATGNGLIRCSYDENEINYFTKADGLPCNEFNIGALHHMNESYAAFGGQGGVVMFNMDSVVLSNYNPFVEVSSVVVYNRKGKRELPVYSGAVIDLSISDFLVNIYFTSLDHTSPDKLLYRYKINGSNWVYVGNQNYSSFSKMQPGTYTIEISGTNSDRKWSDNTAVVVLRMPSPWYSSWWAYVLYTLVLFVFVLIGIDVRTRRLRLTNQVLREKEASAKQVAKQKDRLSILHKDLTASISYASRIQRALFPPSSTFKRILPYSFVMHRPKDIISGDFYWVAESGNKVVIAVIDCTGHGVPGALMSVIAVDLLNKFVVEAGCVRPSEILQRLSLAIYELFVQDDGAKNIADGMDAGLCVIDRESSTFEFSGAIHSLYQVQGKSVNKFKGDRTIVGMSGSLEENKFKNHIVEYAENDMFYMSSDGYSDQFGGDNNKKYKKSYFVNFLVSISGHDLESQQLLLENNFDKWRGEAEQIDDVLVVGFQPKFF